MNKILNILLWFCIWYIGCMFVMADAVKDWKLAITHLWDTAHVLVNWEIKEMWVAEYYKNDHEEKVWLVELKTWVVENMVYDYSCPDIIWHWECSIEMSKEDLLYFLDK